MHLDEFYIYEKDKDYGAPEMNRERQIVNIVEKFYEKGRYKFTAEDIYDTHQQDGLWPSLPYSWRSLVTSVMRTLESVGLVQSNDRGLYTVKGPLSPDENGDQPDRPDRSTNGTLLPPVDGIPPGVPPFDGGGDDGGDGGNGAGYREVLSHPFLFVVPRNDLDRILEQIGDRS